MTVRHYRLTSLSILTVAGFSLCAQSVQTGEVLGVVRDKAGQVIAGATVRARSNQIDRVVVANAKGEFRLPLLNAGNWTITVIKEGYQTSSVPVHIAINETRVANFSLIPTQGAVVEVVDALGRLDTTSTQVGVNVSSENLAKIPMDMTELNALDGLMATVPGVRTAGSGVFQVMGGTNDQNAYVVDGTLTNKTYDNTSTSSVQGASVQPAREFIESVEVVTHGFGAEYGVFGGVVNALTKSGSNSYEGSVFYGTNFPHSSARTFYQDKWTPTLDRTPEVDKFHRYGFTASGPIVKDVLFFFVGYQGFRDVIPPSELAGGSANWNGLKSDNVMIQGPNQWTAKLNWFINSSNQLVLSATRSHYRLDSGHQYYTYGTLDMGSISEDVNQTVNLTWNFIPTPNLLIIASVGQFKRPTSTSSVTGLGSAVAYDDFRYFVTGPGRNAANKPLDPDYADFVYGTNGTPSSSSDNPNKQYRLDVSWRVGQHEIKAGYLRQETTYVKSQDSEDDYSILNESIGGDSYDYLDRLRVTAYSTKYFGVLQGYYLKDIVSLAPGLRLDAGLRFDSSTYKGGFAPYDGMHLAEYNHFNKQLQPRIGLVWDIDQDGRKKVFAHFGRFFMAMPMTAISWAKTGGIYEDLWFPGSWSYNPNYTTGSPVNLLTAPDYTALIDGGIGKPLAHATNLRLPRKNTWTVGTDWTLGKGWNVGANWTFWELKDVLEDSFFLNEDGTAAFSAIQASKVTWNPGPGKVTFVDSDGVVHTWTSNFPTPKDRYIGLNLHASWQTDRNTFMFNYTWTHHYGNFQGESPNALTNLLSGSSLGSGKTASTAEWNYAKGIVDGNMEGDPVHEFKFQEMCRFPVLNQDLEVGMTAIWQSGIGETAFMAAGGKWVQSADTLSEFGGVASDGVSVTNKRCDMGRAPWNLQVNLDLSTTFKVARRISIRPNVSIANIFNSRTVLGVYTGKYTGSYQTNQKLNPNFGLALSDLAGRSISAGCSITF